MLRKYVGIREDEDVYYSVGIFSDESRTKDDPFAISWIVWVDADTCHPDNFRLPPSVNINTSPGRWHCIWVLDEPVPLKDASEASRRIAAAHADQGCDRGWHASKLLRVPGTSNTKSETPAPVTAEFTDQLYTLDTINAVYHDIELSTAVDYVADLPDLISGDEFLELEERLDSAGLSHLYLERPNEGQSWSERAYKLEMELFRIGLTPQEVFSIMLESSVNKYNPENAGQVTQTGVVIPRRNNPDKVLWNEVQKAYAEFLQEDDIEVEPSAPRAKVQVNFLSVDERKYVTETPCFIDHYTNWVAQRTDSATTYQRSLAWLLLSTVYGGRAYLPLRWGKTELNLWVMILGDTTQTRKTTAKSFFLRAVHNYEHQTGELLDIGSEATAEALIKTLGTRDGLVSVLNTDEVVGMFRELLTKNYMSGAIETFTKLYDGEVPVVLRATKDSGNRNRARTVFNFVGVGIRKATAEILTKNHFESGFLARMLWSVADPPPRKPGSEDAQFADEESAAEKAQFDAEMDEIIAPFLRNVRRWPIAKPREVRFDDASLTRYNKWAEEAMALSESYGDDGILVPSFQRMKTSIMKSAALLAVHDNTQQVTLRHLLPALAQAELWYSDMVRMAAEVSSSEFERRCNEVENFILGDAQGKLESAIRKRFARYTPTQMNEIIQALMSQGRVRRMKTDRQRLEALS